MNAPGFDPTGSARRKACISCHAVLRMAFLLTVFVVATLALCGIASAFGRGETEMGLAFVAAFIGSGVYTFLLLWIFDARLSSPVSIIRGGIRGVVILCALAFKRS